MTDKTKLDYIRRLYNQGKLSESQVLAAAKYHKLVYSGYSSRSLKLEHVDCQAKYHPNLSAVPLSRLKQEVSQVLMMVIIHEKTLIELGFYMGETSKTRAWYCGLEELKRCLDVAYGVLC